MAIFECNEYLENTVSFSYCRNCPKAFISKRTKLEILKERGKIIGLPWIFGTLVFCKLISFYSWKVFFTFDINFIEAILLAFEYNGLHLWFLINLIIYCLLIVPVLNFFRKKFLFDNIK